MGSNSSSGGGGGDNNRTKFGYTKPKTTLQKVGDFVKGGGVVGAIVRGVKKSKANKMDYEGQAAGVTPDVFEKHVDQRQKIIEDLLRRDIRDIQTVTQVIQNFYASR